MEYIANISRKKDLSRAAVLEDLDLSESDSGSESEVTPGQGWPQAATESGRLWKAAEERVDPEESRPRPVTTPPNNHLDIPQQQPQLEQPRGPSIPPDVPQQPQMEPPRGPPGFNPMVRIQEI